jgi:hypothetical protein
MCQLIAAQTCLLVNDEPLQLLNFGSNLIAAVKPSLRVRRVPDLPEGKDGQ